MKDLKFVAFDWDGVMVDTVPRIHAAVRQVFEAEGLAGPSLSEYCRYFRHTAPLEFYRKRGVKMLDEEIWRVFHEAARDAHVDPDPHPGASEIVLALLGKGHACAIVSLNSHERIISNLGRIGLASMVDRVFSVSGSKAEILKRLAREHQANAGEAFLVGGSVSDVEDGISAGFTVVGFSPPHHGNAGELLGHGAQHCVSSHSGVARLFGV